MLNAHWNLSKYSDLKKKIIYFLIWLRSGLVLPKIRENISWLLNWDIRGEELEDDFHILLINQPSSLYFNLEIHSNSLISNTNLNDSPIIQTLSAGGWHPSQAGRESSAFVQLVKVSIK